MMQSATPPQSVFLDVDADAEKLHRSLLLIRHKAIPILRVADESAVQDLIQYADANNLGDVTFCVPYEKRALLPVLRHALPLSRGMLDCRESGLPANPADVSGECQCSEATMLLVKGGLSRNAVLSLQKRFMQIWIETEELIPAILSGACGILTQQPEKLYDILEQFPSGSVVRPTLLYAHKSLHGSGEFPENSIPGAVAAGLRGYDACEIDICFTSDDVLVVHHDQDSKNLFAENCRIVQTAWADLKKLRRKAFPDHGFTRFDELMYAMSDHPETPVLIEIKTPAATYGVEKAVQQMKHILADPRSQKNCTCIMGACRPISVMFTNICRLCLWLTAPGTVKKRRFPIWMRTISGFTVLPKKQREPMQDTIPIMYNAAGILPAQRICAVLRCLFGHGRLSPGRKNANPLLSAICPDLTVSLQTGSISMGSCQLIWMLRPEKKYCAQANACIAM